MSVSDARAAEGGGRVHDVAVGGERRGGEGRLMPRRPGTAESDTDFTAASGRPASFGGRDRVAGGDGRLLGRNRDLHARARHGWAKR